MATSKIKIYQTVLTPARNALVDDLEAYLWSLTPTYQTENFQYQKFQLDFYVKINRPQNVISGHSLGNYVRFEQDGKIWYYFIRNTDWKGVNTVELKLSIDSINTFRNDLTWSDKTTIQREHRDRFYKQKGSTTLIRRIDPESEQIQSLKILESNEKIQQSGDDLSWYLIYKTRDNLSPDNPNNPIYCYTIADKPLTITKGSGQSYSITFQDLAEGFWYYFTDIDNPYGSRKIKNPSVSPTPTEISFNSTGTDVVARKREGAFIRYIHYHGGLYYQHYEKKVDGNQGNYSTAFYTDPAGPTNVKFVAVGQGGYVDEAGQTATEIEITTGNFLRLSHEDLLPYGVYGLIQKAKEKANIAAGSVERKTITIKEVDKTDSRIVKIIKLPYAPCKITYDAQTKIYTFPDEWNYESGRRRLEDGSLSTDFESRVAGVDIPELFIKEAKPSPIDSKDINRESKLYHSDFYTFKFVYDSFAREIPLEYIKYSSEEPNLQATSFDVYFKPTNTINSKFAFRFDFGPMANFGTFKQTIDYENYLLINRNNEETIFSNDYLNYIRNGYNYDQKVIERELEKKTRNLPLSVWGKLITAAGSAVFGSALAPNSVMSAASAGVSVTAALSQTQSIFTQCLDILDYMQSSADERQHKLDTLAAQSTAVSGSDDVDLLSYYNGNKLELKKYITEPQQREAIYKLLFYCGYSHKTSGIPDLNSRYWFNFIQCKPVFNEEGNTPYNDYIDDIKSRYETGITVYHHHPGVGGWDWNQQFENWEVNLVPQVIFKSDWITNLGLDDHDNFVCHYNGPVELDNIHRYIEFQWFMDGITPGARPTSTGNTKFQDAIKPNSDVWARFEAQNLPGSALRARIVDEEYTWASSDWIGVALGN